MNLPWCVGSLLSWASWFICLVLWKGTQLRSLGVFHDWLYPWRINLKWLLLMVDHQCSTGNLFVAYRGNLHDFSMPDIFGGARRWKPFYLGVGSNLYHQGPELPHLPTDFLLLNKWQVSVMLGFGCCWVLKEAKTGRSWRVKSIENTG